MAIRIAGVNIPSEKRVEIGITYIFGIGKTMSNVILEKAGIDKNVRVKDLKEDQINKLRTIIEKEYRVEGDLRRDITGNIKRLKEINCWRGNRHTKGLPVRGQRTKTNARTRKGPKKTMGSGRKMSAQKT